MKIPNRKWLVLSALVLAAGIIVVAVWLRYEDGNGDDAFASGNGRIEAVEIDIAANNPGRIQDILVQEGDFVTSGQVVAQMDTDVLEAQLQQAREDLRRAESEVATARSQLLLREADKESAEAVLAQRKSEYEVAEKRMKRYSALVEEGAVAQQEADDVRAQFESAAAVVRAARSNVAAAEAAVEAARARVDGARSAVEAARANIERIKAEIADSTLRAPRSGRVQYIVARPGEVVAGGGTVLNMVDLNDVYMTFFLPTTAAGRIALGSEARLVLDAAPRYVVPARVSFIADVAQFTAKTVETEDVREKLMFRVRAQIPPELLREHLRQVKTGLPGMAHVRLDPEAPWPERLQVNVPQ